MTRPCPKCGAENPYYLATVKRFKCRKCYKQYTETSGTENHGRKLPLEVLRGIEDAVRGGSTAPEIMRRFGIGEKTAWSRHRQVVEKIMEEMGRE